MVHADPRNAAALGGSGRSVGVGGYSQEVGVPKGILTGVAPSFAAMVRNYQMDAPGLVGQLGNSAGGFPPKAAGWSGTWASAYTHALALNFSYNPCACVASVSALSSAGLASSKSVAVNLALALASPTAVWGFTGATGAVFYAHVGRLGAHGGGLAPGEPPPASCSWEATNSDFNSWAVAPLTDAMSVPVLNDAASVTLTNGGNQAAAIWAPNSLPTHQSWNVSFRVTVAGSGGADGFAFVVHNDRRGSSAVGLAGVVSAPWASSRAWPLWCATMHSPATGQTIMVVSPTCRASRAW